MSTGDIFYPGFEHAGLETPIDRILTWALCTAVLIGTAVGGLFAAPRRAAATDAVFDA
jgi:hypothetical protein